MDGCNSAGSGEAPWPEDSSKQLWLNACVGAWRNQVEPVQCYINAGGNSMRRLLDGEVAMLSCRFSAGVFSPGLDLINISLQSDSQDVLRLLLPSDAMEEPAAPPPDPRLQVHKLWLEACKSCQHGDLSSIQRFFEAGGAPSRRLLGSEARELCGDMPDSFCEGETLANLALKWDNMAALTFVLEAADAKPDDASRDVETRSDSVREGKEEAGSIQDESWEMRDEGAASSREGCSPQARGQHGKNDRAQGLSMPSRGDGCSFRDSAYRHAEFSAHATEMDIPYIAADNSAARRDNASRLGMQGLWLQACRGAYSNVSNPIVAFLEAGGDVHRRLARAEVEALRMPGCFAAGERLAEIALRRDSGQALASIVSDVGSTLQDAVDFSPAVPPSKRLCWRSSVGEGDYGEASSELSAPCASAHGSATGGFDEGSANGSWDHVWLDAIIGAVAGHDDKVLAYIDARRDLNRRLTASEVSILSHDNSRIITPGMLYARDTLVDICLRFQREEILKALCPNEVPQGAIKRLPSHLFPLEASAIVKEISGGLEASVNGSYDIRSSAYLHLNFAMPCEIRSLPEEARVAIMMEVVDVDARDTLEDQREPIINWCPALTTHSRLFPLHNGGLGDCLLHSTLQAAAGVEDPVTSLRSSLCATMKSIDLYPRWREARAREAFNDGFRADEWQWRKEWTDLVHVASLPKTSLEQTHVWALAHVLRRPIIVYAILNIRNFRDEVVDLARHQGIYLPMLLDRRDCSSNPIALAYVRGHYLGLVGEEKEASTSTTVLLPVTTPDSQLLPVHFLSDMERGSEAAIIREWFCCRHVDGVMCVEQQTPARADRPQACQALISRYVQDLQARFCSKAAHRGGGADGAGSEGGIAGQGGTGTGVRAENDWVRFDDGDEASR